MERNSAGLARWRSPDDKSSLENLYTSWCQAGNPPIFVIWAEDLSKKNILSDIFGTNLNYGSCKIGTVKKLQREKEQREKREKK